MTERSFRCQCGGELVFDDDALTTAHSVPPCDQYMQLIHEAESEGAVSRQGFKVRGSDDKLHPMKGGKS